MMLPMISQSLRLLAFLVMMSVATCLAADEWVVRQDGVGPVKIGMSLARLNAVLGEKLARGSQG